MWLQGLRVTTSISVKQAKTSNTLFNKASKQPQTPLNEPKTTNPHFPFTFYLGKHESNKKVFFLISVYWLKMKLTIKCDSSGFYIC